MKNITNAQELGKHIAEKLGLTFEAKSYAELKAFVEEVAPAICGSRGGYEDDSPLPHWQILADKQTLARILQHCGNKKFFGETAFYGEDPEQDSDSLGDMADEGEIVADLEPVAPTADFLEELRAFSEESGTAFSFKLYNLYPLCEYFERRLGGSANEIVWRIEKGALSTDGQEIVVFDENDGELLLAQSCWLAETEAEELGKYGLRVALEISDVPAVLTLRDCGASVGLRLKYGK